MKNRFLLDQMLDSDVANALNQQGFSAVRISELGMARSADDEILAEIKNSGQVLITLDEDFGDWAVLPLKNHPGVIRVKANPATSRHVLDVLIPFLQKHGDDDFNDKLVIISKRGVRRVHTGKL